MSLPRYPKYKDSGLPWLGGVPKHWALERLKQRCEVFPSNVDKKSYDDEIPVQLCNYTDVYYNERITADMDLMPATASAEQIARFTLRAGDTIITKDSETADDIAVAAFVPTDLPGVVCGYHLAVVRPSPGANGAFVKRLFDSNYVKSCVATLANGLTRVGLGQYELDNLPLPWPPPDEQLAIADFLDRETAKIDGLVGEQRRLIALLAEKRQAAILQAVTKGFATGISMKSSGVDWIGDVPAHWTVCILKRAFKAIDYGLSDSLLDEGEVAILRMGNIEGGRIVMDDFKYLNDVPPELLLSSGDLLYNRTNSLELIGKVGLFEGDHGEPVSFASYLVRLRTNDECAPGYFAYLLNTPGLLGLARSNAMVAIGQCNLNPTRYGRMLVAIPPLVEQEAICVHLRDLLQMFDTLIAQAEQAVALLRERRTALISAAVTGKIDVRGLA